MTSEPKFRPSRRFVVATAAASLVCSAASAQTQTPSFAPGAPWLTRNAGQPFPVDAALQSATGPVTLAQALNGRPGVVNLWATWCTPCVVEKPALNAFARSQQAQGDRFAVLAILAFDTGPRDWQAVEKAYQRHGNALRPLRATAAAERAFVEVFGAGAQRNRTSLPATVLIDRNGVEMGRIEGAAFLNNNRVYWRDVTAEDMAARLLRV
jgi:thiol-disulfide isomerase/thioredoxin